MSRLHSPLALALVCAVSSRVTAQAVSCDSVLRAARADTLPVSARAYLVRRDGELLPARARTLLLETILAHFSAPQPLQLPVFAAGPVRLRMLRPDLVSDSLTPREPIIYGVYDFTVHSSGTITSVVTTIPTLAPGFDQRIAAAIAAAGSDSSAALVPRALKIDALPLELRVTTGAEDGRFRVPPATIFSATFPRVTLVDAKPTGTLPLPQYPELEQDEGRDGEVLIRVVVDPSGAPVISTLEVLHATSPAFALSAARTLARYHFTPAHVGVCNVPQVVELPFWFSLRP